MMVGEDSAINVINKRVMSDELARLLLLRTFAFLHACSSAGEGVTVVCTGSGVYVIVVGDCALHQYKYKYVEFLFFFQGLQKMMEVRLNR